MLLVVVIVKIDAELVQGPTNDRNPTEWANVLVQALKHSCARVLETKKRYMLQSSCPALSTQDIIFGHGFRMWYATDIFSP